MLVSPPPGEVYDLYILVAVHHPLPAHYLPHLQHQSRPQTRGELGQTLYSLGETKHIITRTGLRYLCLLRVLRWWQIKTNI